MNEVLFAVGLPWSATGASVLLTLVLPRQPVGFERLSLW